MNFKNENNEIVEILMNLLEMNDEKFIKITTIEKTNSIVDYCRILKIRNKKYDRTIAYDRNSVIHIYKINSFYSKNNFLIRYHEFDDIYSKKLNKTVKTVKTIEYIVKTDYLAYLIRKFFN